MLEKNEISPEQTLGLQRKSETERVTSDSCICSRSALNSHKSKDGQQQSQNTITIVDDTDYSPARAFEEEIKITR